MSLNTAISNQVKQPEPTLKEKTAKGLFWGGISNVVQQLLSLGFGLFLARLLAPDDYGLVAMLGIFMGIAATIQDSGFSVALINRPFRHEDYNAVFWFSLCVGTVSYITLFFCAPLIAQFFNYPELKNLARVQFLWFFFGSTATAHATVLKKKLMIKERSIITLSAMAISGIIGVILAYKGFAYWALVIQTALMSLIISSLYWLYSPWRPTFTINITPLKEMFSFGVKILISGFFLQINSNIFAAILGKFYTKIDTGYFAQGEKWMKMGSTNIIGNMLSEVTQPVLVETMKDTERKRNVFRKMLRFSSFISFPAMLGLAFVANEFVVIALSEKWLPSVLFLQMLCVWGATIPISGLYTQLIMSKNRSDIYMWNVIGLGIVQLIIILSTLSYGIQYMAFLYVIINIVWILAWHYSSHRLINLRLWHLVKDVFPFLTVSVISIIITWFFTKDIMNIYLRFILKVLLTACIYISIMWYSKSVIVRECFAFVMQRKEIKK